MKTDTTSADRHDLESDLHGDMLLRNTFVITLIGAAGFLAAVAYTVI